jgi:eukaryotic-like serine/threonine-protein kinase
VAQKAAVAGIIGMSMTSERWQQIKSVLQDALELPVHQRTRFVAEACSDDPTLRQEVESFLAIEDHEVLTGMLESSERRVALPPGTKLGDYEVQSLLGMGGMGEVYRARDTRLRRDVAIKVLPSSLLHDAERLRRFEQEARATAALNHPNILAIFQLGTYEGAPYMVSELLEGETLREQLKRGRLALRKTVECGVQIARGLAAAHEKGIAHRDLKPENLFVTKDGRIKILDFGLAKLMQAQPNGRQSAPTLGNRTEEGMLMGTVGYMAPEQVRGQTADHRTDIFAFGTILYEVLTGKRAFQKPTSVETMNAILNEEPASIHMLVPAIPLALQRIVERCLEKNPEQRFQSAQDLAFALEALSDAGSSSAMGPFRAFRPSRRWMYIAKIRDLVVGFRTTWPRLESRAAGDATTSVATSRARSRNRYIKTTAAAVGVVAVLAGLVGAWTAIHRLRADADRRAAIADIERLVDAGRFVDVWRIAQPALRRWPKDLQLQQLQGATTMTVTIATDPPGADIAFKALDDVKGKWIPLGRSPLKGVRAPLGMLRWRLTKSGFEPIEARLEVGPPAAAVGRPDVNARPIRLRPLGSEFARMVFVPGGAEGGVQLTDYWLDRTEVTNRDFKSFIDRGGYEDARYWTELAAARQTAGIFRDRTGRPGPSTWELGTFPDGQDDYPVNGVSWFEALAYCRSIDKTLPTISHWRKAFGATFFMEAVTVGNFNGRGPESTTRLKDVGPWGTFGMAGNVKEWVWNEINGKRYILGGAWNEPVYMATADDFRPPMDRAAVNGFRCVKETAPSAPAAYAPSVGSRARDYTKERPVNNATFEIFRRFYSYDPTPLDARIERIDDAGEWRRERVSFAAAYSNERVLANILIPKNAPPPYQVVIWFPGSYAFDLKHSDGDLPFSYYFDFLPRSGRALVYPVYKGTYERHVTLHGLNEDRDTVIQWSKDLGRTIDYLSSRNDFDKDRIAYYGFSAGAASAIPVVALESRLKAAIFLTGGLQADWPTLPETEPINFAPRIKVPFLMLSGRYDFSFPVEEQKLLFKLVGTAPEHKRYVLFDNAGHVPPRLDVVREVLDWLDRYFGPVPHRANPAP